MTTHLNLLRLIALLALLPVHASSIPILASGDDLVACRNQTGQSFQFNVTGNIVNWITGTDIYTDNSPVSTAAVHAGVLLNGETKVVIVTILAGQSTYLGTTRNGIGSNSYGAWAGSYSFGALTSPKNLSSYRGQIGRMFPFILTGVNNSAMVYGSDIYSDQSDLASAAVHAGVLPIGQTTIIIVTILDGQSSYLGSSRNNITSSSLGAWPGSYSFSPLIVPSTLENYRSQIGRAFPFLITGNTNGWITGTDIYTDNSPVSTAAVHTGVLLNGETKVVIVTILASQSTYLGTTRNGIGSNSYGAWAGSYSFGALTSPKNLTSYRGQIGRMFPFILTGVNNGTMVYGSDIYSDQSDLASAAVHAGVLSIGQTKVIIVTILDGQTSYLGSSRNNIISSSLGAWPGSYSFSPLTAPSTLENYRCQVGRAFPFLITGNTNGWITGTDIYTDNSPVSTAAVHAGVLLNGQMSILIVNILPGMASYTGTTRYGVTSYSVGSWVCSYSFTNRTSATLCVTPTTTSTTILTTTPTTTSTTIPTTTTTMTTARTNSQLQTSLRAADIPENASWAQNGVTVAGGNGQSNELNQLYYPVGLFVDDNETVYIAESGNHRTTEWMYGATSGQVVAGGNRGGNRTDQLYLPTDVIIDKERDSLIICDRGNTRVVRWPRQGGTSGQTILSDILCFGLTMDSNGSLYISDYGKHYVIRMQVGENSGTVVAGGNGAGKGLDQLNGPSDIFVDRYYSVYVSDTENHRVMKWLKGATEGIVVAGGRGQGTDLTQLYYPGGVLVDQLETVYVADIHNNRTMRWSKGATQGNVIVGGNGGGEQLNQLNYPRGLSFDRHGNLYVADYNNNRVERFNINQSSYS